MDPARALWTVTEPYHAVVYFAQEMRPAYEAVGLRGFWRGYFAGRAAPMGAVGAGVVTATFYGFHPEFVARAVPDVWSMASPTAARGARLAGVDAALQRLGVARRSRECVHAAELLQRAMTACPASGRPLFASNADLPWPQEPHLALWQATTLLREHRGDGHVAALAGAGIDGCQAHVLRIAVDGASSDTIKPHRGWSDEEWTSATECLRSRGWLDEHGMATDDGRQQHATIERQTDALAREPVAMLGEQLDELLGLMRRLVAPLLATQLIPYPNAMGVPEPFSDTAFCP